MLFPFAFRSLVMQTRKALESETIPTGHPLQAEKKYDLVGERVVSRQWEVRGSRNEDRTSAI